MAFFSLQASGVSVHCCPLSRAAGGRRFCATKNHEQGRDVMYAVIKTGGKQYRVSEGDRLRVEKIAGAKGDTIELAEVLMLGGERVAVGSPLVSGAKVSAEIIGQGLGKKIVVFKMRRRKRYRRKNGHRQPFTELRVKTISA